MSIRRRLLILLLIGPIMVLAAGGAAVYWLARASIIHQLDERLQAQAESLERIVSVHLDQLKFDLEDGPAATMTEGFYEYRTSAGERLQSGNLADMTLPQRTVAENEMVFGDVDLPRGVPGRAAWFAFRPRLDEDLVPEEDEPHANVVLIPVVDDEILYVVTAIDRRPAERTLVVLLAVLGGVGAVVAVVISMLVTVGVRWGLAPLDALCRRIGGAGARAMSARFDESAAPLELKPIHRELNRLFDRIECTIERERTFADAAAHELRTPLAELRAGVEVALKWNDPAQVQAALEDALVIGEEMEQLVESLLLLSRGETIGQGTAPDHVAAAEVVASEIARRRPTLDERTIELRVDVDDRTMFVASREAVTLVVRNLVDNAAHHTPPRGSVLVTVSGRDGAAAITIENGPVTLGADDVARLFEPFWQADRSRTDRRHVGLGLAVVQRIAAASGLHVGATLHGDRLRMRLTRAEAV